jgi:hypothetical protein
MRKLRFLTLGPGGSCHENATLAYLRHHDIEGDAVIDFRDDFLESIDLLRAGQADFVIQCSAHPAVHLATERAWLEAPVVDTFIYPTKPLALLLRTDRRVHRSLGLVPATAGYVDLNEWETVVDEPAKPVVGKHLLEGRYDAGLTHHEYLDQSDGLLRLGTFIGAVTTTWVVYGRVARFSGEVLGTGSGEYLRARAREIITTG